MNLLAENGGGRQGGREKRWRRDVEKGGGVQAVEKRNDRLGNEWSEWEDCKRKESKKVRKKGEKCGGGNKKDGGGRVGGG